MGSNTMKNVKTPTTSEKDANLDPITKAPGAHPVGVGAGAAGGGASGAAIGAVVGGPIGASVGAVVGAIAGGLVGKEAAEVVNPTDEQAFWRSEYAKRPYVKEGATYEQYAAAYQYGWESYARHSGDQTSFEGIEPILRKGWEDRSTQAEMNWQDAREATHDAWLRLEKGRCCSSGT